MNHLPKITFSKTSIKAFFGSFIPMFVLVALHLLGVGSPIHLEHPVSSQSVSVFQTLIPKLHQISNSFTLSHAHPIIPQAQAAGAYDGARAYVVLNYDTGEVLAEKNGTEKLPIASLTKVMSAVVSLDLASPSNSFTVSQTAANIEPTKIGVIPGQSLTLNELLHAALMTSANDAVQVIKEGVNTMYGSDVFVQAMNEKAHYLGLKNTSFTNPQGFDNPDHGSSVEDLAVLSEYALTQYPLIAQIAKTDYLRLSANADHKQYDLYNWNGLLDVYPGVFGVKIGNTDAAETTTIVGAERDGKRVLVVLLGAPDIIHRDLWTSQLLDLGFSQTDSLPPVNVTEEALRAKYATWKYWQ